MTPTVTGGIKEQHLVRTHTLDCMLNCLPPSDVLSIDFEGAEILVPAGGEAVFRRDQDSAAEHADTPLLLPTSSSWLNLV